MLVEEKICNQLEKLVVIAEKKGWAIGITHPHWVTINAILNCGKKYVSRVKYVGVIDVLQ
ncbi:MAG: divergent polysaccharide deacetylase family protein [Pseudomonadota bacterium]